MYLFEYFKIFKIYLLKCILKYLTDMNIAEYSRNIRYQFCKGLQIYFNIVLNSF